MEAGNKMSKKFLALIIIIIAVIGIYGLFYAVASTVLVPMQLNGFKSQLDAVSTNPGIDDSTITLMESQAALIGNTTPLTSMSQDQRTATASFMNSTPTPTGLNQSFTQYESYNNYVAWEYDLMFKGNVANSIRNMTGNYENISSYSNQLSTIHQKMITDFQNGDSKAYADDLRNTADTMKQYNNENAELKTQLQTIINQLGG